MHVLCSARERVLICLDNGLILVFQSVERERERREMRPLCIFRAANNARRLTVSAIKVNEGFCQANLNINWHPSVSKQRVDVMALIVGLILEVAGIRPIRAVPTSWMATTGALSNMKYSLNQPFFSNFFKLLSAALSIIFIVRPGEREEVELRGIPHLF